MRATIVWSVVGHGVAFVALSRCDLLDAPASVASLEPAPHIELVPIEVVVLDEVAASPPVTSRAEPAPRPESRGAAAITTGHAREPVAGGEEGKGESPNGAPNGTEDSKQLRMRGPNAPNLALSRDAVERIAGAGARVAETPDEPKWAFDPKIKLKPDGGGSHVVRDRVAKVNVAPDGTVDIATAPDFTFKLNVPNPFRIARETTRDLRRWTENVYHDRDVGRSQDLPKHLTAVEGSCNSYNDTMCYTARDWQEQFEREDEGVSEGTLSQGTADITGWLHRKFVGDPYASRKLKILDQTRDQRIQIGEQYRADQRDRSAELVQRNLERLWATTSDSAQRRTALFEIWDECGEGEGPEGVAGQRARSMVIGWIRGKGQTYSAEELRELNARRTSLQRFEPTPR